MLILRSTLVIFTFSVFVAWFGCAINCAQDSDPLNWSTKTVTKLTLIAPSGDAPTLLEGRVLAVDRDRGCLFQTFAGKLKIVEWKDVKTSDNTDTIFEPIAIAELAKSFEDATKDQHAIASDHFVVVYRGAPAYAQWIVGMYERLYKGFYDYWRKMGVELHEPEFPLVVNVFANQNGYLEQAALDGLQEGQAMIGYYHLHTNQTVSYDLTGSQTTAAPNKQLGKNALIQLIRSRPGAERTVATIVHEAVHQLAYNSGLQVRLADNPLWLSEGIAMFFESPDLNSSWGWSGIGKTNQYQLNAFKRLSPASESDWITPLVQDDEQFTNPATVSLAYARSWALTYFLMKSKPKEFAAFMKEMSEEIPLAPTNSRRRLETFYKHFGQDVQSLQNDLLRRISRL